VNGLVTLHSVQVFRAL